jgi:hypothetical protein
VPDDTLEVEAVARLCPDAARGSGSGCLLFVVNRLGAQRGTIHFPSPAALNLRGPSEAEVLFSAFGSRAAATAGGLALDLAPDDVLIVRLR